MLRTRPICSWIFQELPRKSLPVSHKSLPALNNALGDWRKVIACWCTTGIYTGLLFNIFLNDASLGKYADDSTLYVYNKNLKTVISNLRQNFFMLSNWFYDNYVVNPGKCQVILFGVKENEQFDLICNNITLKYSSHEKILGVTMDDILSFDEHINKICKTA